MITKQMLISEIIESKPEALQILTEVGMHCVGCPASAGESLEEACMVHGIDIDEVLTEINK